MQVHPGDPHLLHLQESNDRALLKNLGTWLGLLTFARNKPVLSKVCSRAWQEGAKEGPADGVAKDDDTAMPP